jgi:hypothetical protein
VATIFYFIRVLVVNRENIKIEIYKNLKHKDTFVHRFSNISTSTQPQLQQHLKMATTYLYISYARMSCDKSLVKKTFESILGDDYIKNINEQTKIDTFGVNRKTFIIRFKNNSPGLQEMLDIIDHKGFVQIAYDIEWNRKSRKYIERYWKVYLYVPFVKSEFKPHIMKTEDMQLTELSPSAVFKPEEESGSSTDSIPPLEETTKFYCIGCNCKPAPLVRSTAVTPIDDDKEDTAKDFDELAAAIAHYGEDYPGCIAQKFPTPPQFERSNSDFDPMEEIVWKSLAVDPEYDAETEEWRELKASLELFNGEPLSPPPYLNEDSTWSVERQRSDSPFTVPTLKRATTTQSEDYLHSGAYE